MADVILGERAKKILRIMLKLGYNKLQKDRVMIEDDLKNSPNPIIKNLNNMLV